MSAGAEAPADIRFSFVAVNGITLHVAEAGPVDGPLVILLHGFPEFWYGWRNQIGPLAEAGYRVVAPDQRGYNLSDKPAAIEAYGLDTLASDVVALAAALGHERFRLAGHDWGAIVAWWTATRYRGAVTHLVTMNGPHPRIMSQVVRRNRAQRRKSWYVQFFRLPGLPEASIRARDFWGFRRAFGDATRADAFTPGDIEKYRIAWKQPQALTSMVNWYRALFVRPPEKMEDARVTCLSLILWGARDRHLDIEMAQASLGLCEEGRLAIFDHASHWLLHDEPDAVNAHFRDLFVTETV